MSNIAIGTFGDLGPDRNDCYPDPNPDIACGVCGAEFPYKEYWEGRVITGDRVDNPHEETWRCDECERMRIRREQNESLDQYNIEQ